MKKPTKKQLTEGRRLARIYREAAHYLDVCMDDLFSTYAAAGCCRAIRLAAGAPDHCRTDCSEVELFRSVFGARKSRERFWWPASIFVYFTGDEAVNAQATPRIIALELAALMAEVGQLTTPQD